MSFDKVIELTKLEQELKKIENELESTFDQIVKNQTAKETLHEPNKPKISLLDRLFRTSKYKSLMETYQHELDDYNGKIQNRKMALENERLLIEQTQNRKSNLEEEITKRKSLQITTIELLKEKIRLGIKFNSLGIPIIDASNEKNLEGFINQDITEDFSMDDIVMVHATNYFPQNMILKTASDSNVTINSQNTVAERNTLHFSLNGKVSSHGYGNWDSTPYIFIEPIKTHIDQIVCLKDNDTFTYGSLKLSNDAIILINKVFFENVYKEHAEEIEKNKSKIILFDGDSEIVVNKILILLGYRPQKCGMWSWTNEKNSKFLENYVISNYPKKLTSPHFFTKYAESEKILAKRDTNLNRIRGLTSNYFEGDVISLQELYELYLAYCLEFSELLPKDIIKNFIIYYGINCHDNEIHLLSYKEYIKNYEQEPSSDQVKKVTLLLRKAQVALKLDERRKNNSRLI